MSASGVSERSIWGRVYTTLTCVLLCKRSSTKSDCSRHKLNKLKMRVRGLLVCVYTLTNTPDRNAKPIPYLECAMCGYLTIYSSPHFVDSSGDFTKDLSFAVCFVYIACNRTDPVYSPHHSSLLYCYYRC